MVSSGLSTATSAELMCCDLECEDIRVAVENISIEVIGRDKD